jgi:hypothetical protein
MTNDRKKAAIVCFYRLNIFVGIWKEHVKENFIYYYLCVM